MYYQFYLIVYCGIQQQQNLEAFLVRFVYPFGPFYFRNRLIILFTLNLSYTASHVCGYTQSQCSNKNK